MVNVVVIDTSVLIAYMMGEPRPAALAMQRLESHGTPYWIPELCCQELLQGAADEPEWELLELYLSTQRVLAARRGWDTHRDAARIYFDCRRAGLTPRSAADCFIAQQVLDADGVLLHDDADFERIQQVRPLRTLDVEAT